MKKIPTISILFVLANSFCSAQQPDEAVIRRLENAETGAILKDDTAMLLKLLSPHLVPNNRGNKIVPFKQVIRRTRSRKIDYSSLERIIEILT